MSYFSDFYLLSAYICLNVSGSLHIPIGTTLDIAQWTSSAARIGINEGWLYINQHAGKFRQCEERRTSDPAAKIICSPIAWLHCGMPLAPPWNAQPPDGPGQGSVNSIQSGRQERLYIHWGIQV